jgi:hypothetical protein
MFPKQIWERFWKIVRENAQRILEIPLVSSSDNKATITTNELDYKP